MESWLDEPGRRHEIGMAVAIEIDDQGMKAPLYPRPQRQDFRVGRK